MQRLKKLFAPRRTERSAGRFFFRLFGVPVEPLFLEPGFERPGHLDVVLFREREVRITADAEVGRCTTFASPPWRLTAAAKAFRLYEAQQFLLRGDGDVNSAAYAVGYQSPQQFNRDYKSLFGTTPGRSTRAQRSAIYAARN